MEKGWRFIKWSSLILFLLALTYCLSLILAADAPMVKGARERGIAIGVGIIWVSTLISWSLFWWIITKAVQSDSQLLRYVLLFVSFAIALAVTLAAGLLL